MHVAMSGAQDTKWSIKTSIWRHKVSKRSPRVKPRPGQNGVLSKGLEAMGDGDEPGAKRRAAPDIWDKEARRLVKSEMEARGYGYKALASALDAGGYKITEKALALRINRGTFTLGFALQMFRTLDVRALDISYIPLHKPARRKKEGTKS